jgi:hypothetical protein
MFAAVRQLGQGTPAQTTLVPTHALHDLLARLVAAGGPARPGLRRLAAQCAEFLGWMYQERGEVGQAHRYTRIARDTAPDPDVVAYSWVRHAEISLSAGDTPAVFAYAWRAYDDVRAADRVRGLAGHRMAQAFAVQRKATACRAALGAAERLFERDREVPRDGLGLGSTTVPDLCAATAGWCEYELGQHAVASDALARAVARIPATSRRARGVFGGRLSLSYAAAGDVRTACETGRMALDEVRHTRSATATADLRQLARYLRRWPGRADAQALAVDLAPVLTGPGGYSTG